MPTSLQLRLKNLVDNVKQSRGQKVSFFVRAADKADTSELFIYDAIDDWWGISATQIIETLDEISSNNIDVRVNSPGGVVTEGMAIMTAFARHKATIRTYNDGLAASMASVLMMAGSEITMSEGSWLMNHNPWGFVVGDWRAMQETSKITKKFGEQLANVYYKATSQRDGIGLDEIKKDMDDETWYTPEEAQTAGFIDIITEVVPEKNASLSHNFSGSLVFDNAPEQIVEQLNAAQQSTELSKRTVERLLRDAGASNREAKLMAKGAVSAVQHRDDANKAELLDMIENANRILMN